MARKIMVLLYFGLEMGPGEQLGLKPAQLGQFPTKIGSSGCKAPN
jgi:hypothetical protein